MPCLSDHRAPTFTWVWSWPRCSWRSLSTCPSRKKGQSSCDWGLFSRSWRSSRSKEQSGAARSCPYVRATLLPSAPLSCTSQPPPFIPASGLIPSQLREEGSWGRRGFLLKRKKKARSCKSWGWRREQKHPSFKEKMLWLLFWVPYAR